MSFPTSAEPERSFPQTRAALEDELLRAALEFARRATGVLRVFPGGAEYGIVEGAEIVRRLDAFERRVLTEMEGFMADVKTALADLATQVTALADAVATYIANHPATSAEEQATADAIEAGVANLKGIAETLTPATVVPVTELPTPPATPAETPAPTV